MSIRVLIPRFTPLATVVLLLMSAPVAHAEITVRVASDEATLFVHEPFTLRLDVESDLPPEVPKVPEVPGLAVVAVRRLPSDPAARKHAFEITMIAERDGPATLPSFAVQSGDETARTAPLRIHIRAPRPATEMALAISVEPTALRVGQPAAVTVTWTSEVSLKRCRQLFFEIPLLADARCQVFPLDPPVPETEWVGLPVNGIRVFAQSKELPDHRQVLSFRCMLVPTEPCVLRLPPARLSCALVEDTPLSGQPPSYFYNEFFAAPGASDDYEQVYLAAPTSELVVRAITEPGRSGRFAGIVGPCDLKASIVPADLVVGQPGLLTVHLSDLTFARHITGLPLAAFDGLQPDFLVSKEAIRETVGEHTRSFTYVIRPLRSGITHLPAIVLQTFDPVAGEYRTLRSQTIPITVEPDEQGATRAAATRIDSEPPAPLSGIRQNRKDDRVILFVQDLLSFLGRQWWAFLPLPPLLWLALLPVARRWERCRRDPVYARATAALWRFRRTAWRDEETGLRNYLADRLALCAEALTAETVADALRTRSVDTELITEVRSRFDERDAVDYGKRPAAPARSTRSLVRRLQKATVPLLVVCGLWVPLRVHAAEGPEELFAQAIQRRAERPDEAQPLFVEAALGFESAERFVNAGNSWFFAGESGRALATYRAAERRFPFDPQVRESIEFLRANRADAFSSPAMTTGPVATLWRRFCTWATVLRVGLFVLLYLVGWAFLLTAELRGWRIRRSLAIALIAAVLVPLVSVTQTALEPAEAVVIEDTVARLGPGYAYDPAFKQPLHKATEFAWIENRQGWVRARLPNATEGWLPESACMQVR